MRPPVKSLFVRRPFVQREHCATPGCYEPAPLGGRFCPEHVELYARIRDDLDHPKRRRGHEAGWEQEDAA